MSHTMIVTPVAMRYHRAMKRASFTDILKASWNDILDSLDMRPRPSRYPVLRRGQTIEHAWAATGMYLRRAMDQYEQTAPSRSRKPR
jgi:hypothetical protein